MTVVEEFKLIPIEAIIPNPDNPRKDLGDLTELSESLKSNGFISNLTVIPCELGAIVNTYKVIAGHRRLAAAKLAGITHAPCKVVTMSRKEQHAMMLTENMARNELTIKEQADGFQMMMDLGSTIEDISQLSGFTVQTVKHRLEIAKLDNKELDKAMKSGFTLEDFAKLEKIENIEDRNKIMSTNNHFGIARAVDDYLRKKKVDDFKQQVIDKLINAGIERLEDNGFLWRDYTQIQLYNLQRVESVDEINIPTSDKKVYFSIEYCCWLYFRTKNDKSDEDKKKAEERKRQAEREQRRAELKDEAEQLEKSVRKFISELACNDKNNLIAQRCFVSLACIGSSTYRNYIEFGADTVSDAIEVDFEDFLIDEEFINGKMPTEILYALDKTPARFYFRAALSCMNDFDFYDYYEKYEISENQKCFIKHLEMAGFEPIDGNQQSYLDGTHGAYAKDEED